MMFLPGAAGRAAFEAKYGGNNGNPVPKTDQTYAPSELRSTIAKAISLHTLASLNLRQNQEMTLLLRMEVGKIANLVGADGRKMDRLVREIGLPFFRNSQNADELSHVIGDETGCFFLLRNDRVWNDAPTTLRKIGTQYMDGKVKQLQNIRAKEPAPKL